jgi:hypothetical protein
MIKMQIEIELAGSGLHDSQTFRHDFFANAITGYDCNSFFGHGGQSPRWVL